MPLTFFVLAISIGFLVFLLNYTDFLVEYGKVFSRALKIEEYKAWKREAGMGYPVFIREKYNSFWSRMFGCPYCLITFSSLVFHSLFTSALLFLCGAFLSSLVWWICVALHWLSNKNYE